MAIGTVEFDLSSIDPETGLYNTARAYTVEGVTNEDGSLRELSIGQLVMAICLNRAAALEKSIIEKMAEMEQTSAQLELMTKIENEILAGDVNMTTSALTYTDKSGTTTTYTYKAFLTDVMGMTGVPDEGKASDTTFITALESKMDENNSFSQKSMIELQSLTNKRDQSYDLITNALKSLNTVLVGNVNNF